jgi:hypothetical protein
MSLMMMTNPITPPPELVHKWALETEDDHQPTVAYSLVGQLAAKAAQWGADQELEACCKWLFMNGYDVTSARLCTARRPEPLSLKEQARVELDRLVALIPAEGALAMAEPIRRALEALPND